MIPRRQVLALVLILAATVIQRLGGEDLRSQGVAVAIGLVGLVVMIDELDHDGF